MTGSCIVLEPGIIPYAEALELQRAKVRALQEGGGNEWFIFAEHPPVITLGRNATGRSILAPPELLEEKGVEVCETDRGGDVTFHGPGQLVGYPILSLEEPRRDIVRYVHDLEEVITRALGDFSIRAGRKERRRGVWIEERKIASIGVRIARWVTSHGFALNVATDLSYFSLINPCGIEGCIMTSMEMELGAAPPMEEVKEALLFHFGSVFGRMPVRAAAGEAAG